VAGRSRDEGRGHLPQLGVSEQTFYTWKRKYRRMGVAELRKLKKLEEENRQLKTLVADLTRDKHMLPGKKTLRPARKRALVVAITTGFRVSDRRACRLLEHNSRDVVVPRAGRPLRRPCGAASASWRRRGRLGYRRIHILLRREGWRDWLGFRGRVTSPP
jgi:putative transposase